jgi:hypothetical protein
MPYDEYLITLRARGVFGYTAKVGRQSEKDRKSLSFGAPSAMPLVGCGSLSVHFSIPKEQDA